MTQELTEYSRFFKDNQRIEVGIPTTKTSLFREWATIVYLKGDLAGLQLSRAVLPEYVTMGVGTILSLRTGQSGSGYICRALVVSRLLGDEITVRFIGEVIANDAREFFRVDTFIPLRYSLIAEKSSELSMRKWNQGKGVGDAAVGMKKNGERMIPVSANISGSGISITTAEHFNMSDFLSMELHLSTPVNQVIILLGQVVHVTPIRSLESSKPVYKTALRFFFTDERERDKLVNFINVIERENIKHLRKYSLPLSGGGGASATMPIIKQVFSAVGVLACIGLVVFAFMRYYNNRTPRAKGQIENTYGNSLQQYRQDTNWNNGVPRK